MSFLDLFKKDSKDKILRDYLVLYPGWFLYDHAIKSLDSGISADAEEFLAPLSTSFNCKAKWLTWSHHYKTFSKEGISIPKAYLDEDVSAIELLEIATEKGHFNAPFVLFLIYEYGLDKLGAWKMHSLNEFEANRNPEKAATYRELARSRDSHFEKAYTHIESIGVKQGLPLEHWEMVVSSMVHLDKETKEILETDIAATNFSKLGVFILGGLCQYGSPYASGHIALLLSIIYQNSNREEDFPYLEVFFKYGDEAINNTFFKIAEPLLKKASTGDDRAAFAINHFKIDLSQYE